MPTCVFSVALRTQGGEAVGYTIGGRAPAFAVPSVFIMQPLGDVATCDYLLLSGSDYQALRGASSGGGGDVNVTADIFIGCLLVLCLIGGWIAGAQR